MNNNHSIDRVILYWFSDFQLLNFEFNNEIELPVVYGNPNMWVLKLDGIAL